MRGTANAASLVDDYKTDMRAALNSDTPLVVRLLGADSQLESLLREGAQRLGLDVSAHAMPVAPVKADVVVIDTESPDVWDTAERRDMGMDGDEGRTVRIIASNELDQEACELGAAVDAAAYVRKAPGLETCAALVLLLGVLGRRTDTPG